MYTKRDVSVLPLKGNFYNDRVSEFAKHLYIVSDASKSFKQVTYPVNLWVMYTALKGLMFCISLLIFFCTF